MRVYHSGQDDEPTKRRVKKMNMPSRSPKVDQARSNVNAGLDGLRNGGREIEEAARARRLANPGGYVQGTTAYTNNVAINNEEAREIVIMLLLMLMTFLFSLLALMTQSVPPPG